MNRNFILFLIFILCANIVGCTPFQQSRSQPTHQPFKWEFSWKGDGFNSPIRNALARILDSGEIVTVAPLVTGINTSFSKDFMAASGADIESWRKMIRSELIVMAEQELQGKFPNVHNLKTIDRFTIEKVLNELKFSYILSEDNRMELDKILGVSHIVAIEFSRSPFYDPLYGNLILDVITARLIDVQTGGVLATQMMKRKHS